MKQIKRLTALCIVLVLALTMSIGAFADGSPSTSGLIFGARARYGDGSMKAATLNDVTDSAVKAELENKDFLKQILGSDYTEDMVLADIKDLTFAEGLEFPTTMELDVYGVNANSKVTVLYFDGTEWKKATIESVAELLITVTIEGNPVRVAVIMDKAEAAAANVGTTSPKTGSSPIVPMAVMGAVICMAGAVALTKKERV